ncbi:cadherin-related family member 5 isoform X3 [Phocoena sinus]|uniref:cadherin-related family member 5 isoform X3 n=1 Tax=Phocoena sinus TaxID=42100 RepID=UPI0013C42188|nr:cadherin-related family member 5 isoform X3 [Phocoena sinus]
MVTWALLLPLLVAVAQAQGTGGSGRGAGRQAGCWRAPTLPLQLPVCSVEKTSFEVSENTSPGQLLLNITVPEGQQVTLGPSPTRFAFRIQGTQLFLNVTPDYEENSMLVAVLECKRADAVVTSLRVFVSVLDVNDNPPRFPFVVKVQRVPEDTKVNAVVIPETELKAQDLDKDDILFYTLQEVTPGASGFFSLVGANRPELRLDRSLDFDRWPNMTFQLLVRVSRPLPPSSRAPTAPPEPLQPQAPRPDGRAAGLQDTREESAEPSHSATATLVLEVRPADLRAPWFLPCTYSDGFVCLEAQYHGAVPTGHTLSGPLILHPGPIYAVDGDRGIHQPIVYSIIGGNEDGSFSIDANTGNLTMTKSIPSPKTFLLLVKGKQADHARYSVTQVTVEAQAASGRPPRFPQSLYRGTVALGSGVGVAIKDAAAPSQPLRIRAQDPEFPVGTAWSLGLPGLLLWGGLERSGEQPGLRTHWGHVQDLNLAITYRVTNNSNFRMDGEAMLTGASLVHAGVFYAEVEARNTVTSGTATTVVEVQVSEQEPAPTETAGTTGASSGTTSEAPRPPEPSWGSSTTSSGGDSSPHPSSGTTLRPPASSMPGGPPSVGTSLSLPSASPSGGSAQTSKPGTSLPTSPGPSRTPRPTAGTPGTSARRIEDLRFSVVDMAALGGVLSALLLLALIALIVLVHKHYGHRLKCCCGKALEPQPQGFDNQAFLNNPDEASWAPAPSPSSSPVPLAPPEPAPPEPKPASPETLRRVAESPTVALDGDGPAAVRSILTKERRPEGGYKAVWFGEDIGAEADVVVLNTPASEVDGAGDEGSEGSGDEGAEVGLRGGAQDAPRSDSIYL